MVTRRRVRAAALSGAAAIAVIAPVEAQRAGSGAWIGIRVDQHYQCGWQASAEWNDCDLVLEVVGVQDDGPADRGGLRPGDRLVAINGQDLTFETWNPLRTSLRPGTPVSIDVMRDEARYFVRVTPIERGPRVESGRWVAGPRAPRVRFTSSPQVLVLTLTELGGREGDAAFAITIRDTDDQTVDVQPAAVRVVDGRLRMAPIRSEMFIELPNLRGEIVGSLRGITDSTYRRAIDAVQAMARIRERMPSDVAFREKLSRIAQLGLEEVQLASAFRDTWAGAEFEPARRGLATAMDARRTGLLVTRVSAGAPAARLGLRPGDVVFEANGRPVRTVDDLAAAVGEARSPIEIHWVRRGTEMSARFPG